MSGDEINVLDRKLVFDGFIKLEEATLAISGPLRANLNTFKRITILRNDAVAAVLFCPSKDELVFVSQFRYPAFIHGLRHMIEIPAGMMEANEKPYWTMKREILEETGYVVKNMKFIQSFFVSPGISSERLHLFYAEVFPENREHSGGGLDEEQESINVLHIKLKTAMDWLFRGKILDGKTIIGLQWFFIRQNVDIIKIYDHLRGEL